MNKKKPKELHEKMKQLIIKSVKTVLKGLVDTEESKKLRKTEKFNNAADLILDYSKEVTDLYANISIASQFTIGNSFIGQEESTETIPVYLARLGYIEPITEEQHKVAIERLSKELLNYFNGEGQDLDDDQKLYLKEKNQTAIALSTVGFSKIDEQTAKKPNYKGAKAGQYLASYLAEQGYLNTDVVKNAIQRHEEEQINEQVNKAIQDHQGEILEEKTDSKNDGEEELKKEKELEEAMKLVLTNQIDYPLGTSKNDIKMSNFQEVQKAQELLKEQFQVLNEKLDKMPLSEIALTLGF